MIHGCIINNDKFPEGVYHSGLGRLSLDGNKSLIRCGILRKVTTDEQRIAMKAAGDMIELTEQEWRDTAESPDFTQTD